VLQKKCKMWILWYVIWNWKRAEEVNVNVIVKM